MNLIKRITLCVVAALFVGGLLLFAMLPASEAAAQGTPASGGRHAGVDLPYGAKQQVFMLPEDKAALNVALVGGNTRGNSYGSVLIAMDRYVVVQWGSPAISGR